MDSFSNNGTEFEGCYRELKKLICQARHKASPIQPDWEENPPNHSKSFALSGTGKIFYLIQLICFPFM